MEIFIRYQWYEVTSGLNYDQHEIEKQPSHLGQGIQEWTK